MIYRLADTAAQAPAGNLSFIIMYLVVIFGLLYFIMIRPQRRQQKEQAARLASMEIGDSVRTSGGFIGTIIDIDDAGRTIIVEFGNNKNCRIPMIKEAIVEIEKPEAAVKPVETKEDKKKKKKEEAEKSEKAAEDDSTK